MSGAAVAPWWIAVLDAAGEWGKAPDEIAGGSRILWYARFKARRDAWNKVQALKVRDV